MCMTSSPPLLGKINHQNEVIAQQMRSLREKQEEFTSITENMSEGFLVLDSNTDILSYNTSVLRLLGADAAPAENHGSALALNRSAGFRSAVDGALAGRRSEQLLRQNGRCCQVMANPVLRDGEVEGAVVVVLDITEQEERENLRREFHRQRLSRAENPPDLHFRLRGDHPKRDRQAGGYPPLCREHLYGIPAADLPGGRHFKPVPPG